MRRHPGMPDSCLPHCITGRLAPLYHSEFNRRVSDNISSKPAEPEVVATLDAEYYYFLEAASRVRLSRQIIYEKNVYNSTGETNVPVPFSKDDTLKWLQERFETSRGDASANVPSMEGLRGFAVFGVFLVHFVAQVDPWISKNSPIAPVAEAINRIGNSGVDLFFVLSGYLIYGSLMSRPWNFFSFISRRMKRIYPAFMVVFAVYLALSTVFPAQSKIPSTLFHAGVYLIQNFLLLPGILPIEPMIVVAWSLSYEFFYYLALPLAFSLVNLRKRNRRWRVSFFLLLAGMILGVGFFHGEYTRMIMFISGMLLFEAMNAGTLSAPKSGAGFLFLAAGLMSTIIQLPGPFGCAIRSGALFITFFMVCFTCFSDSGSWLSRRFSWTPLRWLGNMSYSYYLAHGLTLKGAFLLLGAVVPASGHGSLLFCALLPVMFAISVVPAAALYLAVERPFSIVPGTRKTAAQQPTPDTANEKRRHA